jgi:hypothetical protein
MHAHRASGAHGACSSALPCAAPRRPAPPRATLPRAAPRRPAPPRAAPRPAAPRPAARHAPRAAHRVAAAAERHDVGRLLRGRGRRRAAGPQPPEYDPVCIEVRLPAGAKGEAAGREGAGEAPGRRRGGGGGRGGRGGGAAPLPPTRLLVARARAWAHLQLLVPKTVGGAGMLKVLRPKRVLKQRAGAGSAAGRAGGQQSAGGEHPPRTDAAGGAACLRPLLTRAPRQGGERLRRAAASCGRGRARCCWLCQPPGSPPPLPQSCAHPNLADAVREAQDDVRLRAQARRSEGAAEGRAFREGSRGAGGLQPRRRWRRRRVRTRRRADRGAGVALQRLLAPGPRPAGGIPPMRQVPPTWRPAGSPRTSLGSMAAAASACGSVAPTATAATRAAPAGASATSVAMAAVPLLEICS